MSDFDLMLLISRAQDDKTDSGRNHVQALQREAESVLQSLFLSSGHASHRADAGRRTRRSLGIRSGTDGVPSSLTAGQQDLRGLGCVNDSPGWIVIDDDAELGYAHAEQVMAEAWPQLPSVLRPPQQAAHTPPEQVKVSAQDGAQFFDNLGGLPSRPMPPCHHPAEERGDGVDWGLSAGAEALLSGMSGGSVRMILERQAGGTARDQAFSEEINALEGALSVSGVLASGGFEIASAMIVSNAPFRDAMRAAAARLSHASLEMLGWSVQLAPDGRTYLHNTQTMESRWGPPEMSRYEHQSALGGLAGGGTLCGLTVAFLWVPVAREIISGAVRAGLHPSSLWRTEPRKHLLGAPSLEAAVSLAAGGMPCEDVDEGTQISLVGVWVVLGIEGTHWGWADGGSLWVSEDSECASPCVCAEVRRLESAMEPVLLPHAGVHEDTVTVTMDVP